MLKATKPIKINPNPASTKDRGHPKLFEKYSDVILSIYAIR